MNKIDEMISFVQMLHSGDKNITVGTKLDTRCRYAFIYVENLDIKVYNKKICIYRFDLETYELVKTSYSDVDFLPLSKNILVLEHEKCCSEIVIKILDRNTLECIEENIVKYTDNYEETVDLDENICSIVNIGNSILIKIPYDRILQSYSLVNIHGSAVIKDEEETKMTQLSKEPLFHIGYNIGNEIEINRYNNIEDMELLKSYNLCRDENMKLFLITKDDNIKFNKAQLYIHFKNSDNTYVYDFDTKKVNKVKLKRILFPLNKFKQDIRRIFKSSSNIADEKHYSEDMNDLKNEMHNYLGVYFTRIKGKKYITITPLSKIIADYVSDTQTLKGVGLQIRLDNIPAMTRVFQYRDPTPYTIGCQNYMKDFKQRSEDGTSIEILDEVVTIDDLVKTELGR